MNDSRIKPLSEDFIGRIAESKTMVSRSLEKMMLIAIGLSTAVIVGVPVLMYAIDTINTTTELQEAQMAAEQIHNATRVVDTGISNSTAITIWLPKGATVSAVGATLTISFWEVEGSWAETYSHEISVDDPPYNPQDRLLYTVEVFMIGNIIHITFDAVPI
jgi:hypothetical protein